MPKLTQRRIVATALKVMLLCIFILPMYANAERGIRTFDSIIGSYEPDTIAVKGLSIKDFDSRWELNWQAALRNHTNRPLKLEGYLIYELDRFGDMRLLKNTKATSIVIPKRNVNGLFTVLAVYNLNPREIRRERSIRRDESVILDFEEDLPLMPYNEAEDLSIDAWEITDEEFFPEGSNASLLLSGNTWKTLSIDRITITDSTVWSIAILALDGDTLGEVQGFGVSDGNKELFYTFRGKRTIWAHEWNISYQDVRRNDQWHEYRLAIGYDWKIRYGYVPTISKLIFINDNDNTDPPSKTYFDLLKDVTDDIGAEPKPKVRSRFLNNQDVNGYAYEFISSVDNRDLEELTFHWDFGDGQFSNAQNPIHIFRNDGIYSVGLVVKDQSDLRGGAKVEIEVGDVRMPISVKSAWSGDVMLARRYEDVPGSIIRAFGPEHVFHRVKSRLDRADLFVINLESPLANRGNPHPMKDFVFRGNPANVAGLVYANVHMASLANNHVGDYEEVGVVQTMEVLEAAGIAHFGAGVDEYQAIQPAFKSINGVRVGLLGYCNRTARDYNHRPYLDASFDKYGFAYLSVDNLLRSVPNAVNQSDIVVISMHAGEEYAVRPMSYEPGDHLVAPEELTHYYPVPIDSATRELAHLAIDLGADLIIGHHPHVLNGFEIYNGVLIAHSLGNFAFDQNIWETFPSALVWTENSREKVTKAWIEPYYVDKYYPTPAIGNLSRNILDMLADYSRELNCLLVPDYPRNIAHVALDPTAVHRNYEVHEKEVMMRHYPEQGIWLSEPIALKDGGFVEQIVEVVPNAFDYGWDISLGKEILWFGNLESEGSEIWNFNSQFEGRDSSIFMNGRYSGYLNRSAGQQDAITDLLHRLPVVPGNRYTFQGWMKTENARNAGFQIRFHRFRNALEPFQDVLIERRINGTNDWTKIWEQVICPQTTFFANVRWQSYGQLPGQGASTVWADDVELISWDPFQRFDQSLTLDFPSNYYYIQLRTTREVEQITVRYRTVTLQLQ